MPENMASAQSKIFNILLRLINKKNLLKRQFANGSFNAFSSPTPPKRIFKTRQVDQYQIDGHNVFTLQPKNKRGKKHILYLHGGAYITSFVKPHWYFLEDLMANTKCSITAPDYPFGTSEIMVADYTKVKGSYGGERYRD
jgi:acetyl esterase/lipase